MQPSGCGCTLFGVLIAHMLCSDEACAEEAEATGTAAETDFVLCAGCGCVMVALAFEEAETEAPPAPVLSLAA